MKKRNLLFLFATMLWIIIASTPAHALTITTYGYNYYDTETGITDTTLGVGGFTIEDFEDSTLVNGLTVSGNGGFPYNAGTSAWDGSKAYYLLISGSATTTFGINSGATSFGIGLSQFEDYKYGTTVSVDVNGTNVVVDLLNDIDYNPYYWVSNRNMYVRFDAGLGEVINSVNFGIAAHGDGVFFDHVAFNAIPEPTTMLLLGFGLVGLAGARRKIRT